MEVKKNIDITKPVSVPRGTVGILIEDNNVPRVGLVRDARAIFPGGSYPAGVTYETTTMGVKRRRGVKSRTLIILAPNESYMLGGGGNKLRLTNVDGTIHVNHAGCISRLFRGSDTKIITPTSS